MPENQTDTDAQPGAEDQPTPAPAAGRRLDELTRSAHDKMIGGVSTGIARHFDIDPILVRVIFVALAITGAGVVLYLGLWLLLPYDDGRPSVAADWFRLDDREPEVRKAGLIITGVLAVLSVVGNNGWWMDGPIWIAILALGLYWFFGVRPRRRRGEVPLTAPVGATDAAGVPVQRPPRAPKQPPLLFALTLSAVAVALGALRLWTELADERVGGSTYLAVALVVIGLGAALGAWWGRSGGLIALGIPLVAVLAISHALPDGSIGEDRFRPTEITSLQPSYEHGIGRFELDLTALDPADLRGRRVSIDTGLGETVVIVPDGVPVSVTAEEDAGRIDVFDRSDDGQGPELSVTSGDADALVLDIDQTFGHIKVVRS